MAGERTEKATPKKRDEARKKGQVAKSQDINSSAVLLAGLLALSAGAPAMVARLKQCMLDVLQLVSEPGVVARGSIGDVLAPAGTTIALAAGPVIGACLVAGVVINVVQVGLKPMPGAIKPDLKKLNPLTGAKNLFGTRALFETGKGILKIGVVGAVAAASVFPRLDELAALVGMPAAVLLGELARTVLAVGQRVALAYLVLACADYAYQRWHFEKGLKMDKKEVEDEYKQQSLPSEVKSQQRRRAAELARARMMDAVPTADVVVTNPTHYAVALKYDGVNAAPVVVAKGVDHLAMRIRQIARDAGVEIVPDPPLARSLHASVEVGQMIPEELFQAVAQLLAYVYRLAARRAAA